MAELKNRYDFVYYFDVQDGNPNGDPDAGNLPRIDAETGRGLITDVCLKRKVRNCIQLYSGMNEGCDIFIKEKAVLNNLIEAAWNKANSGEKAKADTRSPEDKARAEMCGKYYDIRAFGAVLTTGGKTAGQVRGPIQMTFARSVEPVVTLEHTITRMAVTKATDAQKGQTMGRKYTIPYGLYRCHGFVSAFLADQTGFSEEDLDMFWNSLLVMFEHDHSAARGLMSARKLIIFKHANKLGSVPASSLFDRVTCVRTGDAEQPARTFGDYSIKLDGAEIDGVKKIVELPSNA